MIEWKKFNSSTAGDEIEENDYLIMVNGRVTQASHDAMERNFFRPMEDGCIVYSYSEVTHYAEFNFPEVDIP